MKLICTLLLCSLLLSATQLLAQADPAVNILFQPASLSVATTGTVLVSVLNNGNATINVGCAFITISVPSTIGLITGLAPGSDPNFTGTITSGGASIRIVNSGTVLSGLSAASISVVVQGIAVGGPSIISGNITYDPTQGAACAGAGNLNTQNDNSQTSMMVLANPMPVSLVGFTSQAQPNHTVELAWTTSLETNNKGFQIDRSKDLIHFETVGQLPSGEANSQALKHYQLTDRTPYAGTSYYRLTQTDLSGKATAYPAVAVVLRDTNYGLYPNPLNPDGAFTLKLDEPETALVQLFSPEGRVISFQRVGTQSGNLLLRAGGQLAAGVYVLTVQERAQTRQHRLLVE
jgi:hypothetical protein